MSLNSKCKLQNVYTKEIVVVRVVREDMIGHPIQASNEKGNLYTLEFAIWWQDSLGNRFDFLEEVSE